MCGFAGGEFKNGDGDFQSMKLKRELGLFSTTMYGLGAVFGAGIYALIAIGAGLAGNMLWLAFAIGAVIAVFTGLSYAELSSMFPKDAEYNYTKKAFRKETPAFLIGWALAIGTIIAASTVALGFGGYFSALTGFDVRIGALILIGLMTALNYIGIEESANFNNFATSVEILGLLIVIAAALLSHQKAAVNLLEMPAAGLQGILAGVTVIFFAYIGFENITNISEEVKDSRKTVPKALILTLVISTAIYMLVAIAAVHEVGWEALSQSKAPLTLVVSGMLGRYSSLLSYIALFATANTVLMFLIVPSRILYGISKGGSLPRLFSITGMRGTPYISIALVGISAALIALAADIKTVAQLADLNVLLAYLAVNLSLIALAGTESKRGFMSPRILGVPVLAWLGALTALIMLIQFEPMMWLLEAVIIIAGMAIFAIAKRAHSSSARM
jgi:APA family basic amino acid/polyamine antiporter